jgi:hypothetical protein
MAKIYTTPAAEKTAKAWLHDVTYAAGFRTTSQRKVGNYTRPQWFTNAAIQVCEELRDRKFADVNNAIRVLAGVRFASSLDGRASWKSYNEEGVAKSIVYLAECLQLYWDDTMVSTYELEEFKKTYLGMAVFKYGRYISAIKDTKTKSSSSRTPGQAPKNNYKQSGPQSGNVRDLQDDKGNPGQPGLKYSVANNEVYRIIGENPKSKNTPNVFIKPLSSSGATGKTNKVFFSSGNGYTDCTCFFETPQEAQDFLDKLIAANRIPVDITNPHIVRRPAERNGYFLVGTEFGLCAISAQKLNEALSSDEVEQVEEGFAWDKVMKDMNDEELADLAKWARRG